MTTAILGTLLLATMTAPLADGATRMNDEPRPAGLAAAEAKMSILPESRLWFEGGSTVRGFTCEATALDGAVVTRDGAGPRLAALRDAVESVSIIIAVEAIDCGNDTMHDHMRKALEAEKHPRIEFRVANYDLAETGAGVGLVELRGELTINGTTREVTILADVEERADGTLAVRGSTKVDMTEWGVRPPRLMLGTLRVHDEVEVHFDMALGL